MSGINDNFIKKTNTIVEYSKDNKRVIKSIYKNSTQRLIIEYSLHIFII